MSLIELVDIAADIFYSETAGLDAEVGVNFSKDVISASLDVGLYDIVNDVEDLAWAVDVDGSYSVGFGYDSATQVNLSVSLAITVIPNMTFTIRL